MEGRVNRLKNDPSEGGGTNPTAGDKCNSPSHKHQKGETKSKPAATAVAGFGDIITGGHGPRKGKDKIGARRRGKPLSEILPKESKRGGKKH